MRLRLRTLMIVLALGPPVLAGGWFLWQAPRSEIMGLLFVLLFLLLLAAIPFAIVSIPVILGFVFARIADLLLYFGRHPDNRR